MKKSNLDNLTVIKLFETINKKYGDKTALQIKSKSGEFERYSFKALGKRSVDVFSTLEGLGIEKDEGVIFESWVDHKIIYNSSDDLGSIQFLEYEQKNLTYFWDTFGGWDTFGEPAGTYRAYLEIYIVNGSRIDMWDRWMMGKNERIYSDVFELNP